MSKANRSAQSKDLCTPISPAVALKGVLKRRPTPSYFTHAPAKNKYRSRNSSLCAADVASRNITGHPSAAEYTGHFGNPVPFGSPLRAKFDQYFCISSLS
jgi:hypothetical protein